MNKMTGANLPRVKQLNRASILDTIYRYGPISRSAIAKRLELTLPTITTTIQALIEQGIVQDVECRNKAPSLGRRPASVHFVADSRYFIGAEWGGRHHYYIVTDLRGNPVCRRCFRREDDYGDSLRQAAEAVEEMLAETGLPRGRVLGMGIAVPGLIDTDNQVIRQASITNWKDKPAGRELSGALGLPVILENHAKARAIAVDLFSKEALPEVYAYYFAKLGMACTLMINGKALKCGNCGSGELGHTIVKLDGPVCNCSHRGCLQAIAGESAVSEQCANVIKSGIPTMLAGFCKDPAAPSIPEILKAVDCGDTVITDLVLEAVKYLGLSITNIINFISPQLMIIDSALMASKRTQDYLKSIVRDYIFPFTGDEARLEFRRADPYSGALGACAVAIREFFIEGNASCG